MGKRLLGKLFVLHYSWGLAQTWNPGFLCGNHQVAELKAKIGNGKKVILDFLGE